MVNDDDVVVDDDDSRRDSDLRLFKLFNITRLSTVSPLGARHLLGSILVVGGMATEELLVIPDAPHTGVSS